MIVESMLQWMNKLCIQVLHRLTSEDKRNTPKERRPNENKGIRRRSVVYCWHTPNSFKDIKTMPLNNDI